MNTGKKWKAEEETDDILSALQHRDIVGAVQSDQKGIGADPFKPFSTMSKRERRVAASASVKDIEADKRELHLIRCSQQGQMIRWEEKVRES